ncbi:MAG: DUF1819 family protein [Brumimicrobium sp.]|nr:DUF1819 family protein [Brumimicrobium sp.]
MQLEVNKYLLSYTAASLRVHDSINVIKAFLENNIEQVDVVIGNGKIATGRRIRIEIERRINNLTQRQLDFILEASIDDARRVLFLAICKTYSFIHEFVVEVLREKIFRFDYEITEGDYYSFYNRKTTLHPELEALSESSQYKIKQVLFKILEEAKIIDSTTKKNIQYPFLTAELTQLIAEDNPEYLKIFFVNDNDIKREHERIN